MIRSTHEILQPDHGGTFQHLGELLGLLGRYGKARFNLARLESKEAFSDLGVALAMVVVALGALVVAYAFICVALVWGVALLIGGRHGLVWSAGGLAVLHLLVVGLALWVAAKKARQPKLKETMEELRKEQEWVHNLTKS